MNLSLSCLQLPLLLRGCGCHTVHFVCNIRLLQLSPQKLLAAKSLGRKTRRYLSCFKGWQQAYHRSTLSSYFELRWPFQLTQLALVILACIRTWVVYICLLSIEATFGLCTAWVVPLFDYNLLSDWLRLLTDTTAHEWIGIVIKALILCCEVNFVWNVIGRSFSVADVFETFDDVQLTTADSRMVSGSRCLQIVIWTKIGIGAWVDWARARIKLFVVSFMTTKQCTSCICLLTQLYFFDTLRHSHSLLTNSYVPGVSLKIWRNSQVYINFKTSLWSFKGRFQWVLGLRR